MNDILFTELLQATLETLYMTFVSGIISGVFGLVLGVLLYLLRQKNKTGYWSLNSLLNWLVNIIRSIPFVILLISLIPLTRFLIGTSIGSTAAIIPLSIAATPFMARITENALLSLPQGLSEIGHVMGASYWQLVTHILLPEALPHIINGITLMLINLIGYSAIAGMIGAGGLGDLAIRYGYQRYNKPVMLATIVVLIVLVNLIQLLGTQLSRKLSH